MTPIRLLVYIRALCRDPNPAVTIAFIKAAILAVKNSALSNPDSPNRAHDVAYYCDRMTQRILQMEAAAWPPAELKHQAEGELTSFINILNPLID